MSPNRTPSNPVDDGSRADAERRVVRGLDRASGDAVPDFEGARKHVLTELVRFVGRLRREGATVAADGTLEAARALSVVGLADREPAADALRATLLTGADDGAVFDEEFPTFWHRLRTGIDRIATHEGTPATDGDESETEPAADLESDAESEFLSDAEASTPDASEGTESVDVRISTGRRHATGETAVDAADGAARRYSAVGDREPVAADGASLSDSEGAAIDRFVAALATISGRRTRRAERGDRVDARRALRESLGTGGTAMELPTREPVPSELRCCLLIDVSGSVLDTIDRDTLLAVAERLQDTARRGSVFLFDTDLIDATREFERADGDPATALREAEIEWGGGTRIGGAFETLRRRHPHAVDRRTVVVVVSDGLDVGDPEALEDGVTWLARRADAVVWLNPLAVSPAYEPSSRGMATCLPYVDGLFGFAGPSDLAEAARQLERRGTDGPIGYEHDPRRIGAEPDGGDAG
ncbi:VWA domain-containing protein [Natrinema salsiterrestre]|uniref:VWA domain-containing protein n=1 Tax=Natrinema salsiterrestre TaxID=2950540 RepID=A0A9Q4L4M3_9EURY|nr:VWA domain-containing protein [Natrinema salsiterrestre]MDF9745226.1 VWA domain-containing protein [Natrinema salsiterrestre]